MQLPTWLTDSSGEEQVREGGSGGGEKVEAKTGSYRGMAKGRTHTQTDSVLVFKGAHDDQFTGQLILVV